MSLLGDLNPSDRPSLKSCEHLPVPYWQRIIKIFLCLLGFFCFKCFSLVSLSTHLSPKNSLKLTYRMPLILDHFLFPGLSGQMHFMRELSVQGYWLWRTTRTFSPSLVCWRSPCFCHFCKPGVNIVLSTNRASESAGETVLRWEITPILGGPSVTLPGSFCFSALLDLLCAVTWSIPRLTVEDAAPCVGDDRGGEGRRCSRRTASLLRSSEGPPPGCSSRNLGGGDCMGACWPGTRRNACCSYCMVLAERCLITKGYCYGHACWVHWGAGLEMRAVHSRACWLPEVRAELLWEALKA